MAGKITPDEELELSFARCLSKAFTYMVGDGWQTLIERSSIYLDIIADNLFYSNGDNFGCIKMFCAAIKECRNIKDRQAALKLLSIGDLIHLVPLIFPNKETLSKVFRDDQIPTILAMWRVATTTPQTIGQLLQLPEVYRLAHNLVHICDKDGTSQLLLDAKDSQLLSYKINRKQYKRTRISD